MQVTVNKTVSYAVQAVAIQRIVLNKSAAGLLVAVTFSWLDTAGKVLRTGTNNYTQAQIAASLPGQDLTVGLSALSGLVPSGGNCIITPTATGITAAKGTPSVVNGKQQWGSTKLTDEQFRTSLAPLTVDQLVGLISSCVATLT